MQLAPKQKAPANRGFCCFSGKKLHLRKFFLMLFLNRGKASSGGPAMTGLPETQQR